MRSASASRPRHARPSQDVEACTPTRPRGRLRVPIFFSERASRASERSCQSARLANLASVEVEQPGVARVVEHDVVRIEIRVLDAGIVKAPDAAPGELPVGVPYPARQPTFSQ